MASHVQYYTGHWETQGILRVTEAKPGEYMTYSRRKDLHYLDGRIYKLNVWIVSTKIFDTYEEAVNDAQNRKQALMNSCRKRLARLEAHQFDPRPEQPQQ